LRNWKS